LERKPTEEQLNDITSRWRFYNVATAASVTGFVRAYLFRALSAASGAIYCDTDSIAARDLSRLDFGKDLGQWKDEGTYDRFAIAGKKLYAFHKSSTSEIYDPREKNPNWKIASKGVNLSSDPSAPEIITIVANGGTHRALPQSPTYSITREKPVFIARDLRKTAKDMSDARDWDRMDSHVDCKVTL
jgi:hypothetical protein